MGVYAGEFFCRLRSSLGGSWSPRGLLSQRRAMGKGNFPASINWIR